MKEVRYRFWAAALFAGCASTGLLHAQQQERQVEVVAPADSRDSPASPSSKKPLPSIRFRILGNIQVRHVARELQLAMSSAQEQNLGLLIELDAKQAHLPVVHEMAMALRSRQCPLVIHVRSQSTVSPQLLSLVLLADAWFIEPKAVFWSEGQGSAKSEPDAEEEKAGVYRQEISEWTLRRLKDLEINPLLSSVIYDESNSFGLLEDNTIQAFDPSLPLPSAMTVLRGRDGVHITRVELKQLGLSRHASIQRAIRSVHAWGWKVVQTTELNASVEAHAKVAADLLQTIDDSTSWIKKRLDLSKANGQAISPSAMRVAADESLQAAERAEQSLATVESLLQSVPEILASLPPHTTSVGQTPAKNASRWRSLVQERRKSLEALTQKAKVYGTLK